jgi:hypothetical protein
MTTRSPQLNVVGRGRLARLAGAGGYYVYYDAYDDVHVHTSIPGGARVRSALAPLGPGPGRVRWLLAVDSHLRARAPPGPTSYQLTGCASMTHLSARHRRHHPQPTDTYGRA